eukprot:358826-Chlamydomonas_euryale.AAC.19
MHWHSNAWVHLHACVATCLHVCVDSVIPPDVEMQVPAHLQAAAGQCSHTANLTRIVVHGRRFFPLLAVQRGK